jgi:hypothetical protein
VTRTDAPTSRQATGAKLVASLAVLGGAVAIAGMGTFGTFTDSTTPLDTSVDTGTVSIELTGAAARASVPLVPGGLLPGDTYTMPLDLVNNGTLELGEIRAKTVAAVSSTLNTDPVNGLQVLLESCSQSWDVVGSGYACAGDVTRSYSGPLITDTPLENDAALTAGGVDHLLATVTLPESAGNALQNKSTTLTLTFTGVQRDGAAR